MPLSRRAVFMMQADRIIEGFRLSPQQARLWALPQSAEAYRSQAAWLITGHLDASALRQALEVVVSRHEILRTNFPLLPGTTCPLQASFPEALFVYREVSVEAGSNTPEGSQDAIERSLQTEAEADFNYQQEAPLHILLLKLTTLQSALVMTLPAACADSHTLHGLIAELGESYHKARAKPSDICEQTTADEEIQYLQFSEWQCEALAELATDSGEDDRAYWLSQLRSPWETPTLPGQKSAGPAGGITNAVWTVQPGTEETKDLESLAQRHQVSLEIVLLAGWFALVWRLTGGQRLTLGYLCGGRKYEGLNNVAGLLAKWVPVTCELTADYRFDELLQEIKRITDAAQNWQEYFTWESTTNDQPAEAQSNESTALRCLSLGFQYEVRPQPDWGEGLEVKLLRQQVNTDHLNLYLNCGREGASLSFEFHYHAASFAPKSVSMIAEQFMTMMGHVARAGVSIAISEMELLSDRQRQQILCEWNQTAIVYPQHKCVHQLIEEQAERTPTAVAVASDSEEVTYHELNRRANQLAHYLMARGIEPEQKVGILLERSVEMVIGLLAVLKAGGAYVPLETEGATDRLRYMLEDAQVAVLLVTEQRLLQGVPEHTAHVVCLDTQWTDISALPDQNPISHVTPDNLMYVIYTSGSTGNPKGSLITHRGVVNYLYWAAGEYAQRRPINSLVHTPIAFDLTVTSLYVPLLLGGCLILANIGNGGDALVDGLRRPGMGKGLLKLTPAHLDLLRQQSARDEMRGLGEVLIVGGEALFGETLRDWRAQDAELRIINEYGPTETVVGCCVYEVSAAESLTGPVPIGRPIANSEMYLLDEQLCFVPVGVVGEIYIGGTGLARGYHERPDLTAEKFLPHPFSSTAGARIYRTGDLGRYLSDGVIEYLGRIDSQVKVLGYRVELGEIEAALLQHPATREAIVLARRDQLSAEGGESNGSTRLVAYVVADSELSASEWRYALRDKLPDYMIPSAFVTLDEMPLAKSGKVDRRALPALEQVRGVRREPLVAPRNLTEEILTSIWTEVLHVAPIGTNDNFFDLGGDSMRSIQIRARAKKRGLDISHEDLFQYRTISQLARVAAFAGTEISEPAALESFALISVEDRQHLPEGIEDAYPLAMLQAGMVFHSEFNPEAAIFHDMHSFHLQVRFDVLTMERAVCEVISPHAILRTSFDLSRYTQPLQLVHESMLSLPLIVSDLRELSPEEQEQAIAAWTVADKKQHFVWDRAPLLRFHVHRRADESFQFTMSFHHAILDGWSAASLLTELFGHYLTLLENQASPAPAPLAASFRDFVALEQGALDSPTCKQYWEQQLAEVTVSRLPRLRRPAAEGAVPVEVHDVVIPAEVSEGLKRLASAASVPVKSVLLAAHLRVMSLLGGVRDVVTGLVFNGRPEEIDGEKVLGLFLNTLPFRLDLAGGTWRELAEQVFEKERDSLPFRRYPLAELQRIGNGQPLFETSFNFMHYYVYQSLGELNDVQLLGYSGYEETNFTLTANFSLDLLSGQVRLSLNYHPTELTAEQVTDTGKYYLSTLTAMATDPEGYYQLHSPLFASEEHQLVVESNQTAKSYLQPGLIHQLIEQQVERTPETIALVSETSSLTYRELNQRANQLVQLLRQLGVHEEVRVGVCLPRSTEMVISLLAILKAGGAYVPLDPQYPQELLAFMLADAEVKVLLSEESLLERLSAYEGEVVSVDQWWTENSCHYSSENLSSAVEAEQLAYVIYTSGSTGRPKGVMNTHGAIRNRLLWMQDVYRLNEGDRVLQKTPFSFDVSVWELFWPLMFGAQLVMARPGGHQDSRYLVDVIREHQISLLHFVPSMLSVFIEEDGVTDCRSVRQIVSSGEALSPQLVERVCERMPWVQLDNLYGPTEAAVDVSWWHCERGSEVVPIGRPIANLELYILDHFGQVVPAGVAGELHIGGVGLARGYHQRADLTAERFVPHRFSQAPGARLYRTGDLARFLADGTIEYVGRIDHQVKIRGNRVELGEIELALAQHDSVREAVVVARADSGGRGSQLIAYFVAQPEAGEPPSTAALREHLRRMLPEYMMPSHFVRLEQLPLTPNGKLARQALPLPESFLDSERSVSYVQPQTPAEMTVAEIWGTVMGVARVGRNDNFFELGGHSLLATQVISRLRNAFHVDLPLRALFEASTVAALAAVIEKQRQTQPSSESAAAPAGITSQGATDIDKMLEELEALSAADVEAMLGEERELR